MYLRCCRIYFLVRLTLQRKFASFYTQYLILHYTQIDFLNIFEHKSGFMELIASTKQTSNTTCPYCGVGCGVEVNTDNNIIVNLSGRKDHPANEGRLCVKGSSLHETTSIENRLLTPLVNGKPTSWDSAIGDAADGFKRIIDEHGPNSVAFYLSGQLLTEDYYVANKLMKGFIGTANIDTNSRLCMASAVVAHKRAFGADVVPGCYEDLEKTDVLFFVGSNAAYAHPIVFQRIVKAQKERGIKVVVLDPRRTATCDIADLHLPIKPGSDAFFYNGLLSYLADIQKLDTAFIDQHCDDFDQALTAAKAQVPTVDAAAEYCDVDKALLLQAYEWFAENEKVVSLFSQGINQSSSGVDKGNAIINCHLATGKIGKEGATPFSITGQPNAMGGREVGGLANQLAAHMGFSGDDVNTVQEFWQAPNMASCEGLKAIDLFDAIHRGEVKAVWIMGTNPVVSMPNANKVRDALQKCEMVVVSECVENTDTAKLANVLLPATTWGEKHGTVTNSERTISLQKSFLRAPGEAKNDWQIMCDFAKALGYGDAFNYSHPAEIFAEHAALSGFKVKGAVSRAFNIAKYSDIDQRQYEQLVPIQWPVKNVQSSGTKRLFEDGRFFTENGKARFVAVTAELPKKAPKKDEFIMNTGRVRDQWHTMTRTGKAPRLLTHVGEPFVQIHPLDAQGLGVVDGDLLKCFNQKHHYIGRAKLTTDQRRKEVFLPMHWNNAFSAQGRVGVLVYDIVDPLCGQPEFKHSPTQVEKYTVSTQGFIVSRKNEMPLSMDYWAKITIDEGSVFTFADVRAEFGWAKLLEQAYPEVDDWVTYEEGSGYRALGFVDDCLDVALMSSAEHALPAYQWLAQQLGEKIPLQERFTWLAGSPGDGEAPTGSIICSCFQVGENQIGEAIKNGASSVEALGEKLKCGTNCGSCIPELSSLLAR